MQILRDNPVQPRKTSVAAYLDGTASAIETDVLKGHDQFLKVDDSVTISLTGTRMTPGSEKLKAGAYLAGAGATVALGVAAGMMGSPDIGVLLGLGSVLPAFLGVRHLQAAFTAPSFAPGRPAPAAIHSERFLSALQQNEKAAPGAQKVAYLSGHGSHKGVAGLSPETLGKVLRQSPVDLTILDACSTAQLEVLSQMAPFAGLVLCSVNPVPGKGFPIQKLFETADASLAEQAFEQAKTSTSSLTLIDSGRVKSDLLPALDELGKDLTAALESGQRRTIKRALARSFNPDFFGSRVEMKSFLNTLSKQKLSKNLRESVKDAQAALDASVLKSTGRTLTFRLDGAQDSALPKGWQGFVDAMDSRYKPLFAL